MIPDKTQASHSQGVIAFGLKITLMPKFIEKTCSAGCATIKQLNITLNPKKY